VLITDLQPLLHVHAQVEHMMMELEHVINVITDVWNVVLMKLVSVVMKTDKIHQVNVHVKMVLMKMLMVNVNHVT
jgi:protein gp37